MMPCTTSSPELKPGARVVTRMEAVPGWPLTKSDVVEGSTFHSLYMHDFDQVRRQGGALFRRVHLYESQTQTASPAYEHLCELTDRHHEQHSFHVAAAAAASNIHTMRYRDAIERATQHT